MIEHSKIVESYFQTPPHICRYMVSMIPDRVNTILEPTPGKGNIVNALSDRFKIIAPHNFFDWRQNRVDCVVMNSPFTTAETNFDHAPEYVKRLTGSKIGHYFLFQMMNLSDNIIAIVPWFTLINSKRRVDHLQSFGLISITNLPRSVFGNTKMQTCILQLKKGHPGPIIFKQF